MKNYNSNYKFYTFDCSETEWNLISNEIQWIKWIKFHELILMSQSFVFDSIQSKSVYSNDLRL